jgi:hypothetical protein
MDYQTLPADFTTIEDESEQFYITLGDGIELLFVFTWNGETEGLYFDVYDSQEDPIIEGRAVVYGENLFENTLDSRLPAGIGIFPVDDTRQAETTGITLASLQNDTVLFYIVEVV